MIRDTVPFNATVGTTAARIMGPNPHRRALAIGPPNAGRITIMFNIAPAIDQGINIPAGSTPQRFTLEELGRAMQGDVWAIADAAGRVIGGTETIEAGD